MTLTGEELITVAARYFAADTDASALQIWIRLNESHDIGITRSSFIDGGYATQARRKAASKQRPKRTRPTAPPQDLPPTALTRSELDREREMYLERKAARHAALEARAQRMREVYGERSNVHPFEAGIKVGKKVRADTDYVPAKEWVDTGVRRR